tara:strand:+ start:1514 stop:1756 length:243 start_codon:yes stop_codon:yes gene_type:complete
LSYQESTSKNSEHFKVGDLVLYISHSDGDCGWVSEGAIGVVVRHSRRFGDNAVEVLWAEQEETCWIFCSFLKKILTNKSE